MKKIYLVLSLVCGALPMQAQTYITSPTVSGVWTLSGSPYIVRTNVTIPANNKLRIEPGVKVMVDGPYLFTVNGALQANGSESQKISFRVKDTTGWGNHMATTGGWMGIHFTPAGPSADSSVLRHCTIEDIKSTVEYAQGIFSERSLRIVNCMFTHNRDVPLLRLKSDDPAVSIVVDSCDINNNRGHAIFGGQLIYVNTEGMSYLRNSKIRNTDRNTEPLYITGGRFTIEGNEIYDNPGNDKLGKLGGAILAGWTNELIIRRNKIHHNAGERAGALYIMEVAGPVDIDNNLISNNFAWGAHLCDNGGGAIGFYSTRSTIRIRNNVLANNESTYKGGAINLEDANAIVTNNTIMNNSARHHGKAIHMGAHGTSLPKNDTCKLFVKNNIIQSNIVSSFITNDIFAEKRVRLTFDHNFINGAVSAVVGGDYGMVLFAGDTTHNVKAADPGLQAPTVMTGMIADATTANFSLRPASVCVNKGDTLQCNTLAQDIAGRPRVVRDKVDIGAYELQNGTTGIGSTPGTVNAGLSLYPNPAQEQITCNLSETGGYLQVADAAGRILWSNAIKEKQITVSLKQFVPGLYYVMWYNGTVKETASFIRR